MPGSRVEARLRALAFRGHQALSPPPARALPRLVAFYRRDYPAIFRRHLDAVGASLAVFLLATLLGFVLATLRPEFSQLWLGPDALQGVRRGELWTDSVGHLVPPSLLSTQIFTNNISVALAAWLLGATLGAGTLYLLTMNGLMFGSVLALGWRFELLGRLFAFISAHGPLELFLIVVAGAAGLQLARGQLSWSNRPRRETLPAAAADSARLVAGTLPWFVLLGVVEGFLSPVMTLATPLKVAVGVVLLGAFLAWTLGVRAPMEPTDA
jgi:uncharacterized membrane protein SpoIIM required for sporulation